MNAYALHTLRDNQLANRRVQLSFVQSRQKELEHKRNIVQQAVRFGQHAHANGLQTDNWTEYSVNLQAPLAYDAAREIIYLCSDSSTAYFWPISLEVSVPDVKPAASAPGPQSGTGPADVQVSVKGRFVARK